MMAAWDLAANADVAELVDALDLGSSAERRVGSTPIIRTSGLSYARRAIPQTMVLRMSLDSVRKFFARHAPDLAVIETEQSSATVALAADAHGVELAQIAKTICLRVGDQTMLIVTSGTARLDNRKFKDRFGGKARMLDADQVLEATGHPVGGVCPFGLPAPLPVYCDVSLRAFEDVVPAAGATNAAVRLSPQRLAELVGAEWVDVCQQTAG